MADRQGRNTLRLKQQDMVVFRGDWVGEIGPAERGVHVNLNLEGK